MSSKISFILLVAMLTLIASAEQLYANASTGNDASPAIQAQALKTIAETLCNKFSTFKIRRNLAFLQMVYYRTC